MFYEIVQFLLETFFRQKNTGVYINYKDMTIQIYVLLKYLCRCYFFNRFKQPRKSLTKFMDEPFGEGTTEKVFIILSGYSSRILEMSKVPIPLPVPPPKEWVSWKPCKQSQDSASRRTTSSTESTNSAPEIDGRKRF